VVAVAGARQPAEDQVAEAFALAWASWRKVRQHPAPQAWVVRTALNTGASWWRRRNRELPLADHDLTPPAGTHGGQGSGLASDPGDDPGAGLNDALLAAIRSLPQRQREVIALRIFLDLDTATMARERGSRRARSGCTCPAG
jgi:RNA polymerase sigma-70 factor (ECF subfamily)